MNNIINWLKTHKKQTAVIASGVFLAIFIIVAVFNMIQDRFSPTDAPSSQSNLPFSDPNAGSMTIKTDKDSYATSEKITVTVNANSQGTPVIAFDVVVEFDPQYLSLTKREAAPLDNFIYFGKNDEKSFSLSAVLKPDSSNQSFSDTNLFQVEFTPKKKGKTTIRIISTPGSNSDSNILNGESKDVLGNAVGKEITIE